NCGVGSYHDSEQRKCVSCPAGTYQDEEGQLMCEMCPGPRGRATTRTSGARSVAECG
ncbi:signal peptide, CUB and EGF-like domain-containing protein 2 isoform X3, partial [Silurus asotus]